VLASCSEEVEFELELDEEGGVELRPEVLSTTRGILVLGEICDLRVLVLQMF